MPRTIAFAGFITVIVLAAVSTQAHAADGEPPESRPTIQPVVPLGGFAGHIDDSPLPPPRAKARALLRTATTRQSGGAYYTPAGELVTWYVSPQYRPSDAITQAYVTCLAPSITALSSHR
jgi:hypothetical protein